MSLDAKQQKFIFLRADGLSFDKIAKELKVSKVTLIQWSKLLEVEIKNIQFQTFIQVKEEYHRSKKEYYTTLLKQINKIDDAIDDADLSNVSIKDLFTIKNDILFKLDTFEKSVKADPNIIQKNELGYEDRLYLSLNEIE